MRLISTVAIALALLASLQVKAETGTPTSHAPAELKPVPWTPILVQPSDAPRAVRGSDGMYNLVYDVLLTNYNRHAARLK